MDDGNPTSLPPAPDPGAGEPLSPRDLVTADAFDARRWLRTTRGLALWLTMLAGFGVGGILLHQWELASLAAMAGLFVAAQAADLDAEWRMLHYLLAWVAPVLSAAGFVAMGINVLTQDMAGAAAGALAFMCFAAAIISLSTLWRPVSGAIARLLFRTADSSHTLRLAGRLVLMCLLFALPGWFLVRAMLENMGDLGSLVESTTLGTSLIGYIMLALASIGFLLRREWRPALERLGIGAIGGRGFAIAVLGIGALFVLNASADAFQKHFLHELWTQDQQMNEQIGSNLGWFGTLVLGVSAGVGEEITMRGALQPKLGIVLTALVFASLHVQYSWYGMLVIFLLGMLLGVIRKRSNTTTAMLVHAAYDMLAVLSIGKS